MIDFGSNDNTAFNDLAVDLIFKVLKRDFKVPYHVNEGHVLSLENLKVTKPKGSAQEYIQKKTLSENLVMRVYGDVVELNDKGKKVKTLETKVLLGSIPYRTQLGTYLMGSDYNIISQSRNNPAVYTTVSKNGDTSSAFQLQRGRAFKLYFTSTGLLRMKVGQTSVEAMPLFNIMGVSEDSLRRILGPKMFGKNSSYNMGKFLDKMGKLYFYQHESYTKASEGEQKEALRDYMLTKTKLDAETTNQLVGVSTDHVNRELLEKALAKLLRVYRKEQGGDDRWDLRLSKIYTPSHLFADRLEKQLAPALYGAENKLKKEIKEDTIRKQFTNIISKPLRDTVLKSDLSRLDPQYNMLGAVVTGKTISPVGEGAISSVDLVEDRGRQFHPTHIGVYDPTFTPQGLAVGLSLRAAPGLSVDDDGVPHIKLKHKNSGRVKAYPINKLQGINILLPGEKKSGTVKALADYKEVTVPYSKITHFFATAMYADSLQLVPMVSSMQGPRGIMAATQLPQAVPLVNRESPRVVTKDRATGKASDIALGEDYLDRLELLSPVDGEIKSIGKKQIRVVSSGGQERLIQTEELLPFQYNTGLRIFPDPKLKVGDKVRKGTPLFLTNMHDDTGRLAPGTHLTTAWMVDADGYGVEDGVIISETAASKKLVSEHFYRIEVVPNPGEEISFKKVKTLFKHKYTPEQLAGIDPTTGVIKKGSKISTGDVLACMITKKDPNSLDKILGKVSRSLSSEFLDTSEVWDKIHSGKVINVLTSGRKTIIVIETLEEAAVGSKLTGRYGNKGVVARVLPDDKMPIDKVTGKTIDLILSPASLPSRVNPAQTLEGELGNTGKRYELAEFSNDSWHKFTEKELVKANLPIGGAHKVFDPLTGKTNNIEVGESYITKLFSPEKGLSARGIRGAYDGNMQPVKGGKHGSKAVGLMEFYGLLGHNAKGLLQEFATVKGEKNTDFWRQYELGLGNMPKSTPYTFGKFNAIMTAAGAEISRSPEGFSLIPITDERTSALSKGRSIKELGTYRGTNLETIKGGLFDPTLTGGKKGDLWSEYQLADGIPHPLLSQSIRSILGVEKKDWEDYVVKHDGKTLKKQLDSLDLADVKKRLRTRIDNKKDLSNSVQALRFVENLKNFGKTKLSDFIITKIPIVPPKFRPLIEMPDGTKTVNDLNYLYMDVISSNKLLEASSDLPEMQEDARANLIHSVGSFVGTEEVRTQSLKDKGLKGALTYLTGKSSPKEGFFLNKMMKKQMVTTGRARIIPDPMANMDEVGIPEHLAWNTYEPHLRKELRGRGFKAHEITEMLLKKDPRARQSLLKVLKENYIIVNRAPSLHKLSLIAGRPKLVEGPFISIPSAFENPLNADYDGDEITVHAPVTARGKADAERMLLENIQFTGYSPFDPAVDLDAEAFAGLYMKSTQDPKGLKEWWDDNMPKGVTYKVPLDKGNAKKVLVQLSKHSKGKEYSKLIGDFNRIGIRWASELGFSMTMKDVKPLNVKKVLDKFRQRLKGVSAQKRAEIFSEFQAEVSALLMSLPDTNNLKMLLLSKAKSNQVQIGAIVASPAVYTDGLTGKSEIINGNVSDGYSFSNQLKMNAKARTELVQTKLGVAGPGDLYKQMAFNSRQASIVEQDCGTDNGIEVDPTTNNFNSDDLLGRLLAKEHGTFPKDTIINSDNLAELMAFVPITVRSPSTCETDKGLCAKCYGVDDFGKLFPNGFPISITAINSFSEKVSQKALNAKHSVRSFSDEGATVGLFDSVKNLLTGSEAHISAPIATNSGRVLKLTEEENKSWTMYVDDVKYTIPYPLKPTVKKGDRVEVSKVLATGAPVNTKEIGNTLGLGYARDVFTNVLHKDIFANEGITPHQRNVEVLARELYKFVRVKKRVGEFMPEDVITIQEALPLLKKSSVTMKIDKVTDGLRLGGNAGKFLALDLVSRPMISYLKKAGYKELLVLSDKELMEPVAKGMSTLPLLGGKDWLDTMGFRFLKKNITQALTSGYKQSIDVNKNPLTAYVTNIWE